MSIGSIRSQSLWAMQRPSSMLSTNRLREQGITSQSDSASISHQGFAALMAGDGPPPMTDELAATIGSQLQEDHPKLFSSLDADHDGTLTGDELEVGKDQVRETLKPPFGGRLDITDDLATVIGAHLQERSPDLFTDLDTDEGGTLSATELADGIDKAHEGMQASRQPPPPPPGPMAGGPPPALETEDDSSTDDVDTATEVIQSLMDKSAGDQTEQFRSNLINDILRSLYASEPTSQQA